MYVRMAFMYFEGGGSIVLDYRHTRIGYVGSILMLIGGMVGACWKRWVALLPGIIVLLMAWSPVYPVNWLFVVMAVLLLCYCFYQEWMHRNHNDGLHSTMESGNEMEEMPTYND